MRISRIAGLCAVAVLLTGVATAQFGGLKLPQKKSPPPTGGSGGSDVNVQRQSKGTPEVTSVAPNWVVAGKVAEVTVQTMNMDLSRGVQVESSGDCRKISNIRAAGSEVKFTIDLTGLSKSYSCYGTMRAATGGRYVQWNLHVLSQQEAQMRAQQEAMEKKYKDKATATAALATSLMGKRWSVEFANGDKDTWTLVGPNPDGSGHFKTTAGKSIKVMILPEASLVVVDLGNQCGLNGQLESGQVTGMVMSPNCKWQMMSQWEATVR